MEIKNILIDDFNDPDFRAMFKRYFDELNVKVNEWDKLFDLMNREKRNFAYIRYLDDIPIGFIQFTVITFSGGFFEAKMGFIREFWIDGEYRGKGHGSELLCLAEEYFISNGVYKSILTTDTAERFYIRHGYTKDVDIKAKNNFAVFVKALR